MTPIPVWSAFLGPEQAGEVLLGAGSPGCPGVQARQHRTSDGGGKGTDLSLQRPDQELLQRFPGLITVADVLEGFGSILAGDVEHHLLAAAASPDKGEPETRVGHAAGGALGMVAASWGGKYVRVLVDEGGAVVDLVVDNQIDVILGVVLGHVRKREFLGHVGGGWQAICRAAGIGLQEAAEGQSAGSTSGGWRRGSGRCCSVGPLVERESRREAKRGGLRDGKTREWEKRRQTGEQEMRVARHVHLGARSAKEAPPDRAQAAANLR